MFPPEEMQRRIERLRCCPHRGMKCFGNRSDVLTAFIMLLSP